MNEIKEHKFANEDALYRVLNLIFYAMVGVPLLVFLFLYLEIKDGSFVAATPDKDLHLILLILIPIFALVNVGVAYVFYSRMIKNVKPELPLKQKLQIFYKASIIKYSFLGSATILSIIGLFLTAELIYVALYLFILLIFSLNRPTHFRFRKDMKIKTYPPSSEKRDRDSQKSRTGNSPFG